MNPNTEWEWEHERRRMALECLCAMLSNPKCEPEDVKHNAIVAIRNADALLEELIAKMGA